MAIIHSQLISNLVDFCERARIGGLGRRKSVTLRAQFYDSYPYAPVPPKSPVHKDPHLSSSRYETEVSHSRKILFSLANVLVVSVRLSFYLRTCFCQYFTEVVQL